MAILGRTKKFGNKRTFARINFEPKEKRNKNTPGTTGGPGGGDRTLAVKSRKNARKSVFFRKKIKITIFFAYFF